jgi:hypothetical protein
MLWHTAIEMIMVKKMNRIIKSCREVNAIYAFRGAYNKYDSKYGEGILIDCSRPYFNLRRSLHERVCRNNYEAFK